MKKLKKSFLYLILIVFALPLTVHSKMFIWTDENGVKHVSNTAPPQNSKNIQQKGEKAFDEEKYQQRIKQRKDDEKQKAKEEQQARIEKEQLEQKKKQEKSSDKSQDSLSDAGQFQSISSSKFVWEEKDQQIATITKTNIGNWKIKRGDGFYISLITKRGDLKPRDGGLLVNDMRMLVNIHESLIPYLTE